MSTSYQCSKPLHGDEGRCGNFGPATSQEAQQMHYFTMGTRLGG